MWGRVALGTGKGAVIVPSFFRFAGFKQVLYFLMCSSVLGTRNTSFHFLPRAACRTDTRPAFTIPRYPRRPLPPSTFGCGVGFHRDWLLLIEWRLIWQQKAATRVEQIKTHYRDSVPARIIIVRYQMSFADCVAS